MKVLLLSTDSQVFNEGSAVRERIKEYGTLVEEIHVIVYTRPGLKEEVMGNVYLWPTNNHFRIGYFRRVYGLAKGVIKNREDWVISSQDPFETGWAAYKLKLRFNIPFQVQVHTDFLSPYFSEMSWKNKFRATLAKWLVKKADGIRIVSERIRKSITSHIPHLTAIIAVLPIFVDLQKFRDVLPNEELARKYGNDFLILTVARLEPEKNLMLAIDAVADIMRIHSRAHYVIIGSGSLREVLADKIQKLNLEKRIEIKQVNSDDLPQWYKRANLFLLTSNFEGYGMAAVEAAAAGVPVVMTNVGAALGEVVPVKDRVAIVSAINQLIEQPESRREIIEQQNNFLKNWPTKIDYLAAIKNSWQAILLESKR